LREERRLRVFENRVLRRIFGPIVRVIKSRRMTWAGRMERGGVCTGFWWGNLRERDNWGDPGVDGNIILRWIFRKWDVGVWTGLSWLRIGTGGEHL
jgi:hypothetical protein